MLLVFSVLMLIPHDIPNMDGDTDFCWTYVPAAKGEVYDAYHGFAYTTLLKVVNLIYDDWTLSGRVISTAAATLSVYFVAMSIGPLMAALMLLAPLFWFVGYTLTPDALGWMFVSGAYFFWEKRVFKPHLPVERIRTHLPWAGLFAVLAACTKYHLAPILILGLSRKPKELIQFFAPPLALAGLQIYLNLAAGVGIMGSNLTMNIMEKGTGFDILKILGNIPIHALQIANDMWPLAGIFVVIGIGSLVHQKRWRLAVFAGASLLLVAVSFYSARFLMPLMLPVLVGLRDLNFRYLLGRRLFNSILVAVALLSVIAVSYHINDLVKLQDKKMARLAADARNNYELDAGAVAARKANMPYLLDLKFKLIPEGMTSSRFIPWCKENGVGYIFWSLTEARTRPGLNNGEWFLGIDILVQDRAYGFLGKVK